MLDLSTHEVETAEMIVERAERALPYIDKERVVLAPDCGLKYLPRDVSRGKLDAMVAGARILRERHG